MSKNAGWWYPCKDICFISERHNICRIKDNKIHCDGGPAISYPDGWSIWALNGVRVSKELAEASAEKLDPKILLTEKNAEIRREIVRKIGIERIIQTLGAKVLDKQAGYELLELDAGAGRRWTYLKMKNPSIGCYHLEGVPPKTKTVAEAMRFRNGTDDKPLILT